MHLDKLVIALQRLHKILSQHRVKYIVIGSLADYLLGASTVKPRDIDILVSAEDVEKIDIIAQAGQDIIIVRPIRYQQGDVIRGLYGKVLLDEVTVDILADVLLRYSDKWSLITYKSLLPCTIETRLANAVTVRVPCPEIQAVAE